MRNRFAYYQNRLELMSGRRRMRREIEAQIELLGDEIPLLFTKADEMRKASSVLASSAESATAKSAVKGLGLGEARKRLAASDQHLSDFPRPCTGDHRRVARTKLPLIYSTILARCFAEL
ncbi:MAG: hypothetical protein HY231_22670 [Acidobacteria bacterium]|nr:hypothetical protein [Acidobacteriota bacterium]